MENVNIKELNDRIQRESAFVDMLSLEMGKVIVGQKQLVENLPPEHRDLLFFRLWTLKEAYIKAIGLGLSYPMNKAEFTFSADGTVHGALRIQIPAVPYKREICGLGLREGINGDVPGDQALICNGSEQITQKFQDLFKNSPKPLETYGDTWYN